MNHMLYWQTNSATQELVMCDDSVPVRRNGEVLIRVRAFGLNRADLLQKKGLYPPPPGTADVLGLECSGEVLACDEKGRFCVGDAVMALLPGGGYATHVVAAEACVCHKPYSWSFEEAAGVPEGWATAWLNVVKLGKIRPGKSILIHAAAGGVGAAALQLARVSEARRIFATTRTTSKIDFCYQLGATEVYDTACDKNDLWHDIESKGGVDIILDPIGAPYLQHHLDALTLDGRLLCIGLMGGKQTCVSLIPLLKKRLKILGSTLRNQTLGHKRSILEHLECDVFPKFADGRLSHTLAQVYAWGDTTLALMDLEKNIHPGKLVVRCPEH